MDFRLNRGFRLRKWLHSPATLRAMVDQAPDAEAWIGRKLQPLRPLFAGLYRLRRRLATGVVGILTVWFFLHVMFGPNGMVVYQQKRAESQQLQEQIQALQKENEHYTGQIRALQTDPKTIEKEAREALHYARPGEVVYVSPPAVHPQPPSTDAASK